MRKFDDSLLHSASDLNAYLGCPHSVSLSLRKLLDPDCLPDRAKDDEQATLIAEAGNQHEATYLNNLRHQTQVAEIDDHGSVGARADATRRAMLTGVPVIYQAAFLGAPWHGFADFLRRVDEPSDLGAWSYEPVDTKLARSPKPSHIVQLGLYGELIGQVQGRSSTNLHVALGDGAERSFVAKDFQFTLSAAKDRYLGFVAAGARHRPCKPVSEQGLREQPPTIANLYPAIRIRQQEEHCQPGPYWARAAGPVSARAMLGTLCLFSLHNRE